MAIVVRAQEKVVDGDLNLGWGPEGVVFYHSFVALATPVAVSYTVAEKNGQVAFERHPENHLALVLLMEVRRLPSRIERMGLIGPLFLDPVERRPMGERYCSTKCPMAKFPGGT